LGAVVAGSVQSLQAESTEVERAKAAYYDTVMSLENDIAAATRLIDEAMHATDNMQHAADSMQHATDSMQQTACNTQHACMLHNTCNM
jgi:phage shock protein A